jgi:hypothetical protein
LKTASEAGKISLMSKEVFISHSSEDRAIAHKVYEFLKNERIDCFMDDYDLKGGAIFVEEIPKAIIGSSVVILILSMSSDNSPDVIKELELARTEKKLVVPFRIEKLRPQKLAWVLAGITWIDAFQPPLEGPLRQLAERIKEILRPGKDAVITDTSWHEIDYEDLSPYVKERIEILDSDKQLVARTFIYRKNRYTGKYERKLKKPSSK